MTDADPRRVGKCLCGEPDCWPADDYSWVNAGWYGTIAGCDSAVFFIHGRKIREQRYIPDGEWRVDQLPTACAQWAAGLPGARLNWCHDTGGGDPNLWIEGEREPTAEDWARLEEVRARQRTNDARDYARLKRLFSEDTP